MTSACSTNSFPRTVINPRSPGPAPTRKHFPALLILRLEGSGKLPPLLSLDRSPVPRLFAGSIHHRKLAPAIPSLCSQIARAHRQANRNHHAVTATTRAQPANTSAFYDHRLPTRFRAPENRL